MVATSLPASMRASLFGYWQQARPWQRLGYLVGGALILVGLAHLVAWLVVGGAWAGPITFRKPTTFGISFGLTTVTLAWVAGQLRISDRTGWLLLVPLAVPTPPRSSGSRCSAGAASPPTSTCRPRSTTCCS